MSDVRVRRPLEVMHPISFPTLHVPVLPLPGPGDTEANALLATHRTSALPPCGQNTLAGHTGYRVCGTVSRLTPVSGIGGIKSDDLTIDELMGRTQVRAERCSDTHNRWPSVL
jgi:hypothetical protein